MKLLQWQLLKLPLNFGALFSLGLALSLTRARTLTLVRLTLSS